MVKERYVGVDLGNPAIFGDRGKMGDLSWILFLVHLCLKYAFLLL